MNWTAVQTAIATWVYNASGASAYWAQQKGPRPAGAFISMRLTGVSQIGLDWYNVQDAASPSSGAEIELKTRGTRTATLQLQAFAGPDGTGVGSSSPFALLEKVRAHVAMESIQSLLHASGVSVLSSGVVSSVDGTLGANSFEPRSIVEFTLGLVSEVSEFTTYIETIQVENEDTGDTFEVP